MHVPSRSHSLLLCAALGLGACGDPAAPPPSPPTLTVQGTVFDSLGNPVAGALVDVYPNDYHPSYQDGFVFSDIMTDSLGQYHIHYDSLPASVDRVVVRTTPPGCDLGTQITTIDDPSIPASGPHVITQDVVLFNVAPRATSAVDHLCAKISDQGASGYSGWLFVIVDQSNPAGSAGGLVLEGRWTINWSPTYGSSDGTFLGAQLASRVVLEFRDTTGTVECPPSDGKAQWIAQAPGGR